MNDLRSSDADVARRPVWDLPLRLAHWSLAIAVAGAFATHYAGTEWFPWHRAFGYAVVVLPSRGEKEDGNAVPLLHRLGTGVPAREGCADTRRNVACTVAQMIIRGR